MGVFKVWNQDRTIKKLIIASSLDDLKEKGKAKLGIQGNQVSIVLEEDGTVIDEDELLPEVSSKVLQMLEDGQSWLPLRMTTPTPDNPDFANGKEDMTSRKDPVVTQISESVTQEVQEPACRADTENQNEKGRCISTQSLPIPEFSFYVKNCLRNKESGKVWSKAVEEAANFYLTLYPNELDNHKAYRIIGQKMYNSYPDIKREGDLPWSTFTRALSQKMRAERLARKRKSLGTTEATTTEKQQRPKKQKKSSFDDLTIKHFLSDEDYETHVSEIQKEFDKTQPSESHLKLLLKESFSNRRTWIKKMASGKVKPILEKYSCFEYGKYVWEEFRIIIAEELNLDMEKLTENLQSLFEQLCKMAPKKEKQASGHKIPFLLNFLEKETKYDKGKGEKSSSFLSVHDDIDEKDIDKFTKSGEEEAPKLILFFKGEDTLEMSVIATDTCRIFCQADTVPDAVMMLLASYYVFDLDYPRKYTQCLGFLQQVVIGDAYTGIKSTKFKHFMKKFKSDSE